MPGLVIASCLWIVAYAVSVPQPALRSTSIPGLLDLYALGERDAAVDGLAGRGDLRGLLRDFDRAGRAWILADGAGSTAARRLAAASAALEVAGKRRADWRDARELVEWGCGLLAEAPPHPGERLWHAAALVLIQGAGDAIFLLGPGTALHPTYLPVPHIADRRRSRAHYDHAISRFREDAEIQIAGVRAEELGSSPGPRAPQSVAEALRTEPLLGGDQDRHRLRLADIVVLLKPLLNDETVAAEARVRLAHTYLRLESPDLALTHLREARELTRDPFLLYLTRFLAGRAHEDMGDRAAAAASYREALDVMPAQSAAFALAGLLFVQDEHEEAFRLIEATLAVKAPPPDPWRVYAAGDFRQWPEFIERLREAMR